MGYIGGYNPLIPTFDPNFQRDIQVGKDEEWEIYSTLLKTNGLEPKGPWKVWMDGSDEPRKKKRPYFPLNPGWLIGILTMVYYNPCITG